MSEGYRRRAIAKCLKAAMTSIFVHCSSCDREELGVNNNNVFSHYWCNIQQDLERQCVWGRQGECVAPKVQMACRSTPCKSLPPHPIHHTETGSATSSGFLSPPSHPSPLRTKAQMRIYDSFAKYRISFCMLQGL